MQPPPNWPELTLALALAIIAGYFIADIVARLAERALRAVVPDEHEARLVDRPRRIVRLTIFLIVTLTLAFPALRVAGYASRTLATRFFSSCPMPAYSPTSA